MYVPLNTKGAPVSCICSSNLFKALNTYLHDGESFGKVLERSKFHGIPCAFMDEVKDKEENHDAGILMEINI